VRDPELRELRRVDLPGYLAAAGFERDAERWTRRNPVLRRGGTRVVLSRDPADPAAWLWFEPGAGGGDAPELVRRLEGVSLGGARVALRRWLGPGGAVGASQARPAPGRDPARVARAWGAGRPARGSPYLLSRGIPPAVVSAAAGEVRLGRAGEAMFAHRDGAGALVGYEIRGPSSRSFSGGGGRGLFAFGGDDGGALVLTEAGVDALSAAAVLGLEFGAFGSVGGGWCRASAEAVRGVVGRRRPARLLLGFDADDAGERSAARAATDLADAGAEIARLRPPGGAKDWNEALNGGCQH
jgi:hypothetical protein